MEGCVRRSFEAGQLNPLRESFETGEFVESDYRQRGGTSLCPVNLFQLTACLLSATVLRIDDRRPESNVAFDTASSSGVHVDASAGVGCETASTGRPVAIWLPSVRTASAGYSSLTRYVFNKTSSG